MDHGKLDSPEMRGNTTLGEEFDLLAPILDVN
jgi:hypothetical protein